MATRCQINNLVPNAINKWRSKNKNWNYYETPTYAGLGWLKRK